MNYVVPLCTLKNLNWICMGADSFYDLVRSQPFACQTLIVPSLNLKVLFVNQDPIVNVEMSSFFNMQGASFMVDIFEYSVDVVVYGSHVVKLFMRSGRAEFVVVSEVYGVWVEDIESSV